VWSKTLAKLHLGPPSTTLRFTASDTQSSALQAVVIVHDLAGNAVRRIDGGWFATAPGVTTTRSVQWDGTDESLLRVVPVGLYYYRVIVSDEAGNWAESGESKPIQIKL
jgi:hypothetical protein